MKSPLKYSIAFATLAMLFAGCAHMPRVVLKTEPSKSEVALAELNAKQVEDIKKLNIQIIQTAEQFKREFDANVSLAAASVMSVYDTMLADPVKDKYDAAEMAGLEVAKTALPEPTLADYRKTTETQRKLLSELAKEVQDGKVEIEKQKAEAEASKAAQEKALAEKAALEAKKIEDEKTFIVEKEMLNDKIKAEKDASIAQAQEAVRLEKEKGRKDLEKWVVRALMIMGVLAAILSYVVKGPMQLFAPAPAIASAGCIGLAIAISFLPTWAIFSGLAVVFGLITFAIVREWKEEKDGNDIMVGAIHEEKAENPTKFKTGLGAKLDDWNKDKPKFKARVDKKVKALNLE